MNKYVQYLTNRGCFSTGTFQNTMFTPHLSSSLLTGLMNTGIHLKWMTTGLSTWGLKVHGTKL